MSVRNIISFTYLYTIRTADLFCMLQINLLKIINFVVSNSDKQQTRGAAKWYPDPEFMKQFSGPVMYPDESTALMKLPPWNSEYLVHLYKCMAFCILI